MKVDLGREYSFGTHKTMGVVEKNLSSIVGTMNSSLHWNVAISKNSEVTCEKHILKPARNICVDYISLKLHKI